MKKIISACLFCLLFTGGLSFGEGYIVRKSRIAGETGMEIARFDGTVCDPGVVCSGSNVIDVDVNGQFVLCWTAGSVKCESGPIDAPIDTGNHYFTIIGFTEDRTHTYQEYDPATETYTDKSYTIPGSVSPPSNEAVLIVTSGVPTLPPPPTGCSVKKYIP